MFRPLCRLRNTGTVFRVTSMVTPTYGTLVPFAQVVSKTRRFLALCAVVEGSRAFPTPHKIFARPTPIGTPVLSTYLPCPFGNRIKLLGRISAVRMLLPMRLVPPSFGPLPAMYALHSAARASHK